MKKLETNVAKKDGTTKRVFVYVDDKTAEVLAQIDDEQFVNDYLAEEYKMQMDNCHEHRYTQSLDKSIDNGFDIEDESQNLLESVFQNIEKEKVHKAINALEPQQQWLVYQVFYLQRTKVSIAKELGTYESAIRHRLERILKKIKKFLI